jgi:hypothetical protein
MDVCCRAPTESWNMRKTSPDGIAYCLAGFSVFDKGEEGSLLRLQAERPPLFVTASLEQIAFSRDAVDDHAWKNVRIDCNSKSVVRLVLESHLGETERECKWVDRGRESTYGYAIQIWL